MGSRITCLCLCLRTIGDPGLQSRPGSTRQIIADLRPVSAGRIPADGFTIQTTVMISVGQHSAVARIGSITRCSPNRPPLLYRRRTTWGVVSPENLLLQSTHQLLRIKLRPRGCFEWRTDRPRTTYVSQTLTIFRTPRRSTPNGHHHSQLTGLYSSETIRVACSRSARPITRPADSASKIRILHQTVD